MSRYLGLEYRPRLARYRARHVGAFVVPALL
jgi:hypothetical protein